jgi:hypothetical protein
LFGRLVSKKKQVCLRHIGNGISFLKLTSADISAPIAFQHVSHIGPEVLPLPGLCLSLTPQQQAKADLKPEDLFRIQGRPIGKKGN